MSIFDIFPFDNDLYDLSGPQFAFVTSDLHCDVLDVAPASTRIINLDNITYDAFHDEIDDGDTIVGPLAAPRICFPKTRYVSALPSTSEKYLSLLSLNIVSTPLHFENFLENHCINGISFDILATCETRLVNNMTQLSKHNIPGF